MPSARSKNWNGSKWIEPWRRLAIYIRDEFTCVHCGKDLRKDVGTYLVQLDHVIPHSAGGSDESHNLITSCYECNNSRSDMAIIDFHKGDVVALNRISQALMRDVPVDQGKAIIRGKNAEKRQSKKEKNNVS